MSHSLQQSAQIIASAFNRPSLAVFNQVRGLQQRGRLAAIGGSYDRKLTSYEVVLAAVLTEALAQGVTSRDLATLESTLRSGRNVVSFETGYYSISLEACLPRIAAGERWLIEVTRRFDAETGDMRSWPIWARAEPDGRISRFGAELYPDPLLDDREETFSVLTINVAFIARRLAPLLDAGQ